MDAVLFVQVMDMLGLDGGLLRVRQASQDAWALPGLPGVLAVQARRSRPGPAGCVLSASGGSHPEYDTTSPGVPALFCTSVQVLVRRPAGRVTDCPARAGAAFQGTCFLVFLRGDGGLPGGGTRLSLVAAPAGVCR